MQNIHLKTIEKYIENNQKIPKQVFFDIMNSDNIEEQGMAFQIFDQFTSNIEEMPSQEELLDFYLNYFQDCMLVNRNGEFVESCFMTAVSFASFYKKISSDSNVSKKELLAFRDMLKHVYLVGGEDIQDCVVNGALEHLFEYPEIVLDFKNWKEDKQLRKAYLEALEFHGNPG